MTTFSTTTKKRRKSFVKFGRSEMTFTPEMALVQKFHQKRILAPMNIQSGETQKKLQRRPG